MRSGTRSRCKGIEGSGRRGRIGIADLKAADIPDHLDLPPRPHRAQELETRGRRYGTAFLIHGLFADAESWSVSSPASSPARVIT